MCHSSPDNYSDRVIHREYYPHIDGIRALAVIPVVLFHILASFCPGGFVGVDVFFVISGYLITGGIIKDLNNDCFSVSNFYYRRIRRILPAYFTLIAGVFIIGCGLYYAQPLIYLAYTAVTGTLFSANLYFYFCSGGYFDASIHRNPLLHLWSLSVEEQFYLFIPLLCVILWKIKRKWVFPIFLGIALLSLIGGSYAVLNNLQKGAFYLLHFRAWELLVGALLAMVPPLTCFQNDEHSSKTSKIHAVLATSGLIIVLAAYVAISEKTPFPGLAALPPVIGTALLIRYGKSGWVARLLSCSPAIGIGKISYSLYLWHWPVIVFWKYLTYGQLNVFDYVGMFLLSILAAWSSWRFVEIPVRISSAWTMRRSFMAAGTGIILLVILFSTCVHYRGWPTTLHPDANEWAGTPRLPISLLQTHSVKRLLLRIDHLTGADYFSKIIKDEEALTLSFGGDGSSYIGAQGQPQILLIGDSHAGALRYGMDVCLRKNNLSGYSISCSAKDMFDMQLPETQAVLKKIDEMPYITSVILVQRWLLHDWSNSTKVGLLLSQLEKFNNHLKTKGKTLFILTDVPNFNYTLNDIAARLQIVRARKMIPEWETFRQSEEAYAARQDGPINMRLQEMCKQIKAVLVPLHLSLKEGDGFLFFSKPNNKIVPLYRDADHLSQAGSLRAAQFIMPYIFPKAELKN